MSNATPVELPIEGRGSDPKPKTFWEKYAAIIVSVTQIASGTFYTLLAAQANRRYSRDHPAAGTIVMFIGMSLVGVVWAVQACRGWRPPPPPAGKNEFIIKKHCWLFAIPCFFDMASSLLLNTALYFTLASTYQMLRNVVIVFTTISSLIFLHRWFGLDHWLGVTIVLGAGIGVGVVALTDSASAEAINATLGNVLVIVAQLLTTVFFVSEEAIFKKIQVDALMGVTFEGIFGLILTCGILLPIMESVPDPFSSDKTKKWEDMAAWAASFKEHPELYGIIPACILMILIFNWSSMSVTQYVGASARTVIDTVRTALVWFISLALKDESFSVSLAICYVILILGVLVYNRIIPLGPGNFLPIKYSRCLKIEIPADIQEKWDAYQRRRNGLGPVSSTEVRPNVELAETGARTTRTTSEDAADVTPPRDADQPRQDL